MGQQADRIDLSGFKWYGTSRPRTRLASMSTIRIGARGAFRFNSKLSAQIEAAIPEGADMGLMIGVAPHAIVLRLVDRTQPGAAPLRFIQPKSGAGRRHAVFASVVAYRVLVEQGITVPTTLDAVFYPDQNIVYAELSQEQEAPGPQHDAAGA